MRAQAHQRLKKRLIQQEKIFSLRGELRKVNFQIEVILDQTFIRYLPTRHDKTGQLKINNYLIGILQQAAC